jgi:hypothetical protein
LKGFSLQSALAIIANPFLFFLKKISGRLRFGLGLRGLQRLLCLTCGEFHTYVLGAWNAVAVGDGQLRGAKKIVGSQ